MTFVYIQYPRTYSRQTSQYSFVPFAFVSLCGLCGQTFLFWLVLLAKPVSFGSPMKYLNLNLSEVPPWCSIWRRMDEYAGQGSEPTKFGVGKFCVREIEIEKALSC